MRRPYTSQSARISTSDTSRTVHSKSCSRRLRTAAAARLRSPMAEASKRPGSESVLSYHLNLRAQFLPDVLAELGVPRAGARGRDVARAGQADVEDLADAARSGRHHHD